MGSESVKGGGVPRWLAIVGAITALLASLATIVGLLMNAGIIPRPGAPGPSAGTSIVNSFAGAWESTDVGDGSHQTLSITGGTLEVDYYDDRATSCGGRPAIASGVGSINGVQLVVVFTVSCLQPREPHGSATYTFTYIGATNTLSDQVGEVWTRRT
jgi:hypothetical protein